MRTDPSRPLSDDEIVVLDELLATIPEAQDALDVAMLDGYMVGILLQPEPIETATWLPFVFDAQGAMVTWPGGEPARDRAVALVMRRYNELAASIAGREPFDPIVFELADEAGATITGKEGIAALEPWAVGFTNALHAFPGLQKAYARDDELAGAVVGVLRHLQPAPDADDTERADYERQQQEINRDAPLADLDDAIDELVECVFEVADITRPNRPLVRTEPKLGRNDLCHCGSGRKYKACHGK